jgi:hypothetical protein
MKILHTTRKREKNIVVLFSSNYARALVNPQGFSFYRKRKNAVCNPNLDKLIGIPAQYWKKENGKVVEMSMVDKLSRDLDIKFNGLDLNFDFQIKRKTTPMGKLSEASICINILIFLYAVSRLING